MTSSRIFLTRLALAAAMGMVGAACDNPSASSSASNTPTPSASVPTTAASVPAPAASASSAPAASASAAADGPSPEDMKNEEAVVDELQAHHRHLHQGFAGFIMSSVETLGVEPAQETAIAGFKKEFHQKMKPLREANHALDAIVADGIAAGKLDKAKVDAAAAKAAAAATAVQPALTGLLVQLHAALKPEQRAALVDKVDAHFSTWREANDHPVDPGKPDRQLRHLAKQLNLTKDQEDKAAAALAAAKVEKKPFDPAALEAYVKGFDTAFVEEKFEPKKLPTAGPGNGAVVARSIERMAAFYEVVVPILTPEQRTQLATSMRERHSDKEKEKDK